MFTLLSAKIVPTLPITPGTSEFLKRIISPLIATSLSKPSIETIRSTPSSKIVAEIVVVPSFVVNLIVIRFL